ncbi:AAA family ATPase [Hellea balneolensis]|uniref:AAA family ATPase n=1 Tax=Hellea balneolensis TaxID=287478 RepID=UPI0004063885|nr:AAA family ATPase [Hellea balneolensis]
MTASIMVNNDMLDIPETENHVHCISIMGAAGGVGATSLCVQIAHNIAMESQKNTNRKERTKEPRICLIDLDFEGGACSHHLDLAPNMSVSDLTVSTDGIDRAFVSALTSTHSSGIDLIATPNSLGGNDMVNPSTIVSLLDIVSQMYDHIVIDVPRYWRPWNIAAIGASDRFIILTELTIPALHLARMRMNAVEEKLGEHIRAEVIINKFERRSFRNALRQKDAETALNRDITATICIDTDTLRDAINCGEPAGVVRPESRYVKDSRKVYKLLQPEQIKSKRSAA